MPDPLGGDRPERSTPVLVAAAVVASAVAFVLARRGVSTSPDGAVYAGVARNLVDHGSLTAPFSSYTDGLGPSAAVALDGRVPFVQWPPLFPLALAAFGVVGASPAGVAAVLNPALLGVNVYLAGRLGVRWCRAERWLLLGVVAAVLMVQAAVVTTSPLLFLHASNLSEPLLVTLVLVTLVCLDRVLDGGSGGWWWAAAVASLLAVFTKFVGLPLVAVVAAVAVAGPGPGGRARRWWRAAGMVVVGGVAGVAVTRRARGGTADPLAELGDGMGELARGLLQPVTPSSWPTAVRAVLLVALATALVAGLVVLWRGPHRPLVVRLLPATATAGMVTVQLLASRALVDRNVSLVGRQVAVVQLLVGLVAAAMVSTAAVGVRGRRVVRVGCAAALVLVALRVPATVRSVADPEIRPDQRDIAAAVERLPRDGPLFTNVPDVVWEETGRTVHLVPCREDYFSGEPAPRYRKDVQQLVELVRDGARVVLVEPVLGFGSRCVGSADLAGRAGVALRRAGPRVVVAEPA